MIGVVRISLHSLSVLHCLVEDGRWKMEERAQPLNINEKERLLDPESLH